MSFEIESAVLGGLMDLKNNDSDLACYLISTLKPSFFYAATHREIYKAIRSLSSSDRQFDTLTVSTILRGNQLVQLFDVDNCYSKRSDATTIRQHANELKDLAIERHAISKMSDIADLISNPENGNIRERIGVAESAINALVSQTTDEEKKGLRDGFYWSGRWFDNLEEFHTGGIDNFTIGYDGLDEILNPKRIRPGSLVVVGARPKMGKTFFATGVARHYIQDRNQACHVFSMEMGGQDIYERILSSYAKVNSNDFYTRDFVQHQPFWDTVGHMNADMARSKIMIDDTAGVSINHIKSEVRKANRSNKVGCVIVDYLTLMGGDEKAERNDLKYGEITKQLKILAKELGCMIVLLVQLNRGLENRPDKRPVPSDGRDTGQIEQDCDVWIGLYRERVYREDCPYNFTEAIVRLNRAGDGGTAYLTLQNGYFEHFNTLQAQALIQGEEAQKKEAEEEQRKKDDRQKNMYSTRRA